MAKRKRRHKASYHRRRHSMAGIGSQLTEAVAVIAGAAAGRLVATKLFPTMNEKLKNGAVLAIGALAVPRIVKGNMGKAIGDGMIAAGGIGLLQSFNVIGATDNLSVIAGDTEVLAGDDEVLAGDDLSVMAGMDEMDGDY